MKKKKIIYIKFDPDIPYQDIDSEAKPIERGKIIMNFIIIC